MFREYLPLLLVSTVVVLITLFVVAFAMATSDWFGVFVASLIAGWMIAPIFRVIVFGITGR